MTPTAADGADHGALSLRGRRAVVTGGSRGAGLAIAKALRAAGATVSIVGRTEATLQAAARDLDGDYHVVDLADRGATTAFAERLRTGAIEVDLLVNNAGLAESAPLDSTTDDLWDRTLALDVTAAFLLMRATIPRLVSRGFGRVINIASNAGLTGYAYTSAYTAAKHALVGLTRAVAMEVAHRGDVTVNALCPGFLDTEMTDASVRRIVEKTNRSEQEARDSLARLSPQRRLIPPAEVAHAVVFLCSPLARSIHGQALPLDGGQVMK